MPYKCEKLRLNETQDRRRKLLNEQKKEIKELYDTGGYSLNNLAKMYEVSKKTILLIVNKESAERVKKYKKEHWKEWARTGKEHAEAIRKTRRYKQGLYIAGKLTDNNDKT